MTPELLVSVSGVEVWHGDSLDAECVADVMGERRADLLCVDAPYSERTHAGHDRQTRSINAWGSDNGNAIQRYAARVSRGENKRNELAYAAWSPAEVEAFCALWLPHTEGWAVSITDHVLTTAWESSLAMGKRYVFPPLPWVEIGSRVRLAGDGPSSWTCWVIVSRPRRDPYSRWGTRPGAYVLPAENKQNRPDRITGGKSLPGMVQLVEDYSREGELVVDPAAGGATTLLAAMKTGRRCIGIERDRARAELCAELVTAEARGTTRLAMRRGQRSLFELEEAK